MQIIKLLEQSPNSSELILFFGGWATDSNPFAHIKSSRYDVVMLYDYISIDNAIEPLKEIISHYKSVTVLAWSMGVWAAGEAIEAIGSGSIDSAIAINGTAEPISDKWGISPDIFEGTINNLPAGLSRFNLRMCGSKTALDSYNQSHPSRDTEQIKQELISIGQNAKRVDSIEWSRAIIASKDMITPTANQLRFWEEYKLEVNPNLKITKIEGAHFIFNQFQSWEDIIDG